MYLNKLFYVTAASLLISCKPQGEKAEIKEPQIVEVDSEDKTLSTKKPSYDLLDVILDEDDTKIKEIIDKYPHLLNEKLDGNQSFLFYAVSRSSVSGFYV